MNALANPLMFASAYRQLTPAERVFVDGLVVELERESQRQNERIALALHRPLPPRLVERSRGMLDRALVRAAVSERINEISAANDLTHQRVIRELMNIGFSSIGDYLNIDPETGEPVFDLARCNPDQLSAIKKIEITDTGGMERGKRTFKFELHDKLSALKMLADYTGLLQTDNPHWRADQQHLAAVTADSSAEELADTYAALVAGD